MVDAPFPQSVKDEIRHQFRHHRTSSQPPRRQDRVADGLPGLPRSASRLTRRATRAHIDGVRADRAADNGFVPPRRIGRIDCLVLGDFLLDSADFPKV
ncbi:hypothetical protein ACH347_41045 [Saccharopolyspora sp. 5N102]|uniref:hypothetical protein n=1 Tax=Saccharopolyspora sp. 5N102 TaxID=3375155 RepID=UPI0037BAF132